MDYNSLREGQEVECEVGQGSDGRAQAVRVRLHSESSQADSGGHKDVG